jgi:hypothetical protein
VPDTRRALLCPENKFLYVEQNTVSEVVCKGDCILMTLAIYSRVERVFAALPWI